MSLLRISLAIPAAAFALACSLALSPAPAWAQQQQMGGASGTGGASGMGGSSGMGGASGGGGSSSQANFQGFQGLQLGNSVPGGMASSTSGSMGGTGSRTGTSGMMGGTTGTRTSTMGSQLGMGSSMGGMGTSSGSYVTVSTLNPFGNYYMNPLAIGMTTGTGTTGTRFGMPLYSGLGMTTTSMGGVGGMGGIGGSGMRMGGSGMGGTGGVISMNGTGSGGVMSMMSSSGMGGRSGMMGGMGGFGSSGMGGFRMGGSTSTGGFQPVVRMDVVHNMVRPVGVAGPAGVPVAGNRVVADAQQVLLGAERLPSRGNIRVGLDGGTVVLNGAVGDEYQRRLAEAMIRLTPGVREVRNNLTLEGETLPRPQPIP